MKNQPNLRIKHEMIVNGILLVEYKEWQHVTSRTILTHSRWIGVKKYAVTQTVVDGTVQDETIDTANIDEIEEFKQEWEEKWNPERANLALYHYGNDQR